MRKPLAQLARLLPEAPVTRFAPSPTGYLHLGHVASALFVWGIGRAVGARILLRIEDHDRSRSRPAYERAILEDLAWLGFEPDQTDLLQSDAEGDVRAPSDFRQSDCDAVYRAHLEVLSRNGRLFGCACTRKSIERTMSDHGIEGADELRYLGTCRDRGLSWDEPDRGLRLVMPGGEVRFNDGFVGDTTQDPAQQCGDLLLRDRHGSWTYQYAVVVDDLRQGVNLVIRGEDLLASTGRQIALARMLGRDAMPLFIHHPLISDDQGKKLSKRFLSEAVRNERTAGVRPEVVLGEAAHHVGLIDEPTPVSVSDVTERFRAWIYG